MVPIELMRENIWCIWKREMRDGRPTKIPYNPKTTGRAESNNPDTFSAYDIAYERYMTEDFDGMGILLANGNILNMTPVTVVGLLDQPGSLANLLDIFTAGGIDIEYMYALFTHTKGKAYMVFRVTDDAKLDALLAKHGIAPVTKEELGLK